LSGFFVVNLWCFVVSGDTLFGGEKDANFSKYFSSQQVTQILFPEFGRCASSKAIKLGGNALFISPPSQAEFAMLIRISPRQHTSA